MRLLLAIAFLESFATICMERGLYFYSSHELDFSSELNLWLALIFGGAYVAGALTSHGWSRRITERGVVLAAIASQAAAHVTLGVWPATATLFVLFPLLGYFNGAKWPVIESYVSAGKGPLQQSRAIGHFNISWAVAVPLALVAFGPLKDWWVPSVFFAPAAINIVCLAMSLRLAASPTHLAEDHAERPVPEHRVRLAALLTSHRWLMVGSYTLMFLLAPLLPELLKGLGVSEEVAPGLSGVMDVLRIAAFLLLGAWAGWHGRTYPIVLSMIAMPIGLYLILFGGTVTAVVVGQVVFGLAAGLIYFGSLYYGMLLVNASVEGGGAHEGLIGSGFAIGPAIGLLAMAVQPHVRNDAVIATLVTVGPLLAACSLLALWPLWRARRQLRG